MSKLRVVQFLSIIFTGLTAGTFLGSWMDKQGLESLSATLYTTAQQARNSVFDDLVPPLIIGATVLTFLLVALLWKYRQSKTFAVSLAAFICLAVMSVSSLSVNVPINKQVNKWNAQAPPANWQDVRHRWNVYHDLRTALGIVAFGLLAASVTLKPLPVKNKK